MHGKIVFITGATSGIGKATAIGLAGLGAAIVFTGRDKNRGEAALKEIIDASGSGAVEVFPCDLSSFESIRSCCDAFKAKYHALHVLINNAAVWHAKMQLSKDGIEDTFATNYLAPFLMTNLLLDVLKKSSPSRIVNLSSGMHGGTIHFDDIEYAKSYNGKKAYIQSKLAVILYSKLLAKKLNGTGVTVNAVHPGLVSTNLGRDFNTIIRGMFKFIGKATDKGAETSLYVASSSEVDGVSGEYFAGKKIARSSKYSYDMVLAERLWEISEKYVCLK